MPRNGRRDLRNVSQGHLPGPICLRHPQHRHDLPAGL